MSSSQSTNILLLGAGELGTAFLPHLSALENTHISLAVRQPQNYTHLAGPNISITQLDLTSPSHHLCPIFSTFDILISATGFGADPSTVLKLATEALEAGRLRKERGQRRLWFFPWQWGVDYDVTLDGAGLMPLFGAQKAVRDLLREKAQTSGVKWSVVSTGIFMSFLFEEFWSIVDRTMQSCGVLKVRCLRNWEHKVTVTAVDDIGRVLARIVKCDIDAEDKVVYVAGDTVSYGELANIIERVSGTEILREQWSVPYLEEELRKDPNDGIKKYRLVFARNGVWWDKTGTVNAELGMEMMDVETCWKAVFETEIGRPW